jgi:hypothetical protein
MEGKEEEKVNQKHSKESKLNNAETDVVELIKNKFTRNTASPFINKSKHWEDKEHWNIPEDIQANIRNNLEFLAPSNI